MNCLDEIYELVGGTDENKFIFFFPPPPPDGSTALLFIFAQYRERKTTRGCLLPPVGVFSRFKQALEAVLEAVAAYCDCEQQGCVFGTDLKDL